MAGSIGPGTRPWTYYWGRPDVQTPDREPQVTSCPNCGAATTAEQRFCGECGAALAVICSNCRAPVKAGQRFCAECGTPVGAPARPADAPQPEIAAEVRLVSVLFVDLVGFTSLSESRDAEDMRDLLSRYFAVARTVVGRYGGTIEKFIGDAVMAVWGTPVAHEDDANRAVRAAIELVAAVAEFGEQVGAPDLRARGGIATGRAASWANSSEGLVVGDRVNTAARVQSAAAPGSVLVDQLTREATAGSIEYREGGIHEVKGKSEPLHLWQAVRAVQALPGRGRRPHGEVSLRGRDSELRLLKELLHGAFDKRNARLVAVSGPAGIGKSVLIEELARYVHGLATTVHWHEGACSSYGEGSAYSALGEMVRQRLGLAHDSEPEVIVERVRESLGRLLPDREDQEFAAPKLELLLGLPGPALPIPRDELFAGWRLFLEGLARTGPVVLMIDNLQWANDGLLDFFEYLLDWSTQLPILAITLSRPELLQRRGSWGSGQRYATTIHLDSLTPDEIGEILDQLVPVMPAAAHRQIVERSEGIPLYAVETVHMLTDRGLVIEHDGQRALTAELTELDTPVSLEALIAARLDELAIGERSLLKDLAVLGLNFNRSAIAATSSLSAEELDLLMGSLVRKEVLVLMPTRRSGPSERYSFTQSLLRSIAYDRLGKRERRSRHLAVAQHLTEALATEGEELSESIAGHYRAAYLADRSVADSDEVRLQAVSWLVRAALRSSAVGAPGRAAELQLQAAELTPAELEAMEHREVAAQYAFRAGLAEQSLELYQALDEAHRQAGRTTEAARLAPGIGSALGRLGRADEAVTRLEGALVVLDHGELDPALAGIRSQLARELSLAGRRDEALPHVERALELAEALDLPQVLCDSLETKALLLRSSDRPEEALILFDGTVEIATRRGLTAEELLSGQANSGDTRMANDIADAITHLENAIGLARRLGQRYSETFLSGNLMLALIFSGDWARAESLAAELLEETRQGSEIIHSRLVVLWSLRGDLERAGAALDQLSRWESHNSSEPRTLHSALQGTVLLAEGDFEAALRASRSALEAAIPNFGLRHEIARQAWPDACQAALRMGSPHQLGDLIDTLSKAPAGRVPPYLRAQLARYRALASTGEGDATVEELFTEAADSFTAMEYPYWAATTTLEWAAWSAERGGELDEERVAVASKEMGRLLSTGAGQPRRASTGRGETALAAS